MNVGWAIDYLRQGRSVTREGWYGKHQLRLQVPDEGSKMTQPYVYIITQRGDLIPWLCSQADLLADDWHAATERTDP